jgi:predicted transcriptional regulator of viral defense system
MSTFVEYIKSVRASGKQYFTTEQALADLNVSKNSLLSGLYRLKKEGDVISPAQGLYVIVPPEHQNFGCIPAEELLPILMKHLDIQYYAGLLTAALYHGASHQKPQVFQIVTSKTIRRKLMFGKVCIDCTYKKSLQNLPVQDFVVKSGYLKVSSPELTAIDLLLYPNKSGGLNHIATVLIELIEAIAPDKLIDVARIASDKACLQRLGYILENIDPMDKDKNMRIISALHKYLSTTKLVYMPLAPGATTTGARYCKKWMIIENSTIESDI